MENEKSIKRLLELALLDFETVREKGSRCAVCLYKDGRGFAGECNSCYEHSEPLNLFRWRYADESEERLRREEIGRSDS